VVQWSQLRSSFFMVSLRSFYHKFSPLHWLTDHDVMFKIMKITVVYLGHEMLLTKNQYQSWREVQDEFEEYTASLVPWSAEEVIDYLVKEHSDLHPSTDSGK
jgi:hypothetical protein